MALLLELAIKRRAVAVSRIIPCLSCSSIISNTGCERNREIATFAGIKEKKETSTLASVVKREFATNSHDIFNVVCWYPAWCSFVSNYVILGHSLGLVCPAGFCFFYDPLHLKFHH